MAFENRRRHELHENDEDGNGHWGQTVSNESEFDRYVDKPISKRQKMMKDHRSSSPENGLWNFYD